MGHDGKRVSIYALTGGTYVYGSYPDRAVYAPIWEPAFLNGAGPRVQESGLGLISGSAYSAPYEGVTLKGK